MAAPQVECTKEQHRPVILFLWSQAVKTGEVYGIMRVHCGDNCMRHRNVYKWAKRSKGGQGNVDDALYGRPSIMACAEIKDQTYQRIRDNRIINIHESVSEMCIIR